MKRDHLTPQGNLERIRHEAGGRVTNALKLQIAARVWSSKRSGKRVSWAVYRLTQRFDEQHRRRVWVPLI